MPNSLNRVAAQPRPKALVASDAMIRVQLKSGLTVFRDGKHDAARLTVPFQALKSELGSGKSLASQISSVEIDAPYVDAKTSLTPQFKNGSLQLDIASIRSGALGNNPLRLTVKLKNGHTALLEVKVTKQTLETTADKKAGVLRNIEVMKRAVSTRQSDIAAVKASIAKGGQGVPSFVTLGIDGEGAKALPALKQALKQLERALVVDQKQLAKLQRELKRIDAGTLHESVTGTFDTFQ